MTTRYYKYERNARAAARKAGLDPDAVVQPCAAGMYSVDFGDVEPVEPEPQGEPAAETVEDKPASGSPGPQLLADLFNKPIEEMRAVKEALELPPCLQREPETAEETARIEKHAKAVSSERELVVRKTSAPKVERKPTKIDAVLAKAKSGITMDEVKAMTGWSKTGGFFGAVKRHGLTLTKTKNGKTTVYVAAE
jgi:hypothetical protein